MGKLNVTIVDVTGQKEQRAVVPDDAPVGRIIAKLVQMMKLPTTYPYDQPQGYKIIHTASGRELEDDQTLAQQGVKDGDVLRLMPEITAGGGYEPSKEELNEIPPTGRGTFGEAGDVARDAVNCTIFGPPEACVGDSILVQVYAHIPDRAQEARSLAHEFDTDARRRGFTSLGTEIRRGTELTFEMTMNSVVIDEPVQQLVWQGYTQGVSFCAGIPKVCTPRVLVGRIMISQESVPNRGTTAA